MNENNYVNLKLLKEIQEIQFALLETILYLDTHPEDRRMLNLHNNFARELCHLTREYQENYGLLRASYSEADSPWQWIEEPWPWQINY